MVLKNYVENKAKKFEIDNPEKFKEEKDKLELETKKKKKKKKKISYEEKLLNKYTFFEFDIVIRNLIRSILSSTFQEY
jgi:hypothetical protein